MALCSSVFANAIEDCAHWDTKEEIEDCFINRLLVIEALVVLIDDEVIGYGRCSEVFVVIREEIVVFKRAEDFIEGFDVVIERTG